MGNRPDCLLTCNLVCLHSDPVPGFFAGLLFLSFFFLSFLIPLDVPSCQAMLIR